MVENQVQKRLALAEIAGGASVMRAGRHKFSVLGRIVHIRFSSGDILNRNRFQFVLYANALNADYELWVCGAATTYYLLPMGVARRIHEESKKYANNRKSEFWTVSIYINRHIVTYGAGQKRMSLRRYFRTRL